MDEQIRAWVDHSKRPTADPYIPWGRTQTASRLIDFRTKRSSDGPRDGVMLPMRRLRSIRWMDQEPDQTNTDIGAMWLEWPDYRVTIHGAWMAPLRNGLLAGQIDWVQEYDASRWPVEPDANAGVSVVFSLECQRFRPYRKTL